MDWPIHIMFEVTQRCNNDCVYCYNVWKDDPGYPRGELSFAEIKKLFDKLTDEAGLNSLTLTGGEPLLHRDIEDIVSYFRSKKIEISLATNGTLLDEKKAESLVRAGLKSFEIPILSTDRSLHNSLSRNDAYDKACEAITNLKAHAAVVTVVFVATKENISHFDDVAELAFALDADSLMIDRFLPGGEGKKHANRLEPGREELALLIKQANAAAQRYTLDVSLGIPLPPDIVDSAKFKNLKFCTCGAGKGKWAVDSLGNLRLCEQEPCVLGNLLSSQFSELKNKEISPPSCCRISCGPEI